MHHACNGGQGLTDGPVSGGSGGTLVDGLLGLRMAGRKLPTGAIRTYHEIAAEMGIPWSQVQSIERRALRKLRKALEAQGFTGADMHPEPEPDGVIFWTIQGSEDGE